MKKYTNKILWISILALIVISCCYITIRLQTVHHRHPEYFKNDQTEDARMLKAPEVPEAPEASESSAGAVQKDDSSTIINVY